MRARLLAKWDAMVYRLAFKSMQRQLINNPGLAYLFEMSLRAYREAHPLSQDLQRKTEKFFKLSCEIAEDLRTL